MISETRRRHYLDALGIDAWVSRASLTRLAARQQTAITEEIRQSETMPLAMVEPDHSPASYSIGPGLGQTLLLCERQEEASSRLASDIAGCLDEAPVWGWKSVTSPIAGMEGGGLSLETAIRDRLFTRVLIFGGSAQSCQESSFVIGSAQVIQVVSLAVLGSRPEHKRKLWSQLVAHGWCKRYE